MNTSITNVRSAALALLHAEDAVADRAPITNDWSGLDLSSAYAVQEETLSLRLDRGERLVGIKLGLTSRSKQQQMGVTQPIVAFLTDAMILTPGETVSQELHIHPLVEPEIVFVIGDKISGLGNTAESAATAVESVHCGIEVIDSRFRNFSFKLPDVVADNASSAAFVLGPAHAYPTVFDLGLEACTLEIDGQTVGSGTGADALGHPLEALAIAANMLSERGWGIEPGWVVLTGGLTAAVAVTRGAEIAAHFTHLGSVTLNG